MQFTVIEIDDEPAEVRSLGWNRSGTGLSVMGTWWARRALRCGCDSSLSICLLLCRSMGPVGVMGWKCWFKVYCSRVQAIIKTAEDLFGM